MRLVFGKDLGPASVVGMQAASHCAVLLDGEQVGFIYRDKGTLGHYEYRGKPVGKFGLTWIAARAAENVVTRLQESLKGEN